MSNALIYCIKPQNNYIFIVSSKVNYSSSYECFYKRLLESLSNPEVIKYCKSIM